jgi:hypothetical protein
VYLLACNTASTYILWHLARQPKTYQGLVLTFSEIRGKS